MVKASGILLLSLVLCAVSPNGVSDGLRVNHYTARASFVLQVSMFGLRFCLLFLPFLAISAFAGMVEGFWEGGVFDFAI